MIRSIASPVSVQLQGSWHSEEATPTLSAANGHAWQAGLEARRILKKDQDDALF